MLMLYSIVVSYHVRDLICYSPFSKRKNNSKIIGTICQMIMQEARRMEEAPKKLRKFKT